MDICARECTFHESEVRIRAAEAAPPLYAEDGIVSFTSLGGLFVLFVYSGSDGMSQFKS